MGDKAPGQPPAEFVEYILLTDPERQDYGRYSIPPIPTMRGVPLETQALTDYVGVEQRLFVKVTRPPPRIYPIIGTGIRQLVFIAHEVGFEIERSGIQHPHNDVVVSQQIDTTIVRTPITRLNNSVRVAQQITPVIEQGLSKHMTQPIRVKQDIFVEIQFAPILDYMVLEDNVTVNQSIAFEIVKPISNQVKVAQSITYTVERMINIIQSLPINQHIVQFTDDRNPTGSTGAGSGGHGGTGGGSGSGNSGNVWTDPEVVAYQGNLTPGTVTFTAGSDHITLKKPEFGDTNSYEQFRVQRNSLGGSLIIFKDQMWPVYEKFDLSWDYLDEQVATALLLFLQATIGKKMSFLTHFGETFQGYIITPFEQSLQPKRLGWAAAFTFQVHNEPNSP